MADDLDPLVSSAADDGSPQSPAAPAAAATARRSRLAWLGLGLAALLGLAVLSLGGGGAWLWATEAGTRWALAQVPGLTVQGLQGAPGRGQLAWQQLSLATPAGQLQLNDVRLEGLQYRLRPAPGQWLGWQVAVAEVGELRWQSAPAASPATPASAPLSLRLPLALQVEKLRVAKAQIDSAPELRDVQARISLGDNAGARHQLQVSSLLTDRFSAQGEVELATDAPLRTQVKLRLQSQGNANPWQAELSADGPLAALPAQARLSGQARPGQAAPSLDAQAELRPWQPWPLGELRLSTRALDLSALASSAPRTSLRGELRLRSAGLTQPAEATVSLNNDAATRWDQGGLPLRSLRLALAGTPSPLNALSLSELQLELGAGSAAAGRLSGQGRWQRQANGQQSGDLKLNLDQLRPATLDQRLPAMSLSGPLTLDLSNLDQPSRWFARLAAQWRGQLDGQSGPTVALNLQAEGGPQGLTITQAQATAGAARASLSGQLSRLGEAGWRWQAEGALSELDPALWWRGEPGSAWRRGPHRLNLQLKGSGQGAQAAWADPAARWRELTGQLQLQISNSQLSGVPLQGELTLQAAGEASSATGQLQAGSNRLNLEALPGRSRLVLDAPALASMAPLWAWLPSAAAWAPQAGSLQATLQQEGSGSLVALANANANAKPGAPAGSSQWQLKAQAQGLQSPAGQLAQADVSGRVSLQAGRLSLDAPLALQLRAEGLAASGGRVDALQASIDGSLRRHQLSLQAESPVRPPAWFEQILGARTGSGSRFQLKAEGQWLPGATAAATPATKSTANSAATSAATSATPNAAPAGRNAGTAGPSTAAASLGSAGLWQLQVADVQGGARDGSGQPWLQGQNLRLVAELGPQGSLRALRAEPGRLVVPGTALQWREARYQAGTGASGLPRLNVDAQIEPFAVAPLLARAQPELGWRGDLMLAGSVLIRSDARFDADVVFERRSGDLSVADDVRDSNTRLQSLGLSDLRLALSAHDGVWHFTQALAGRQLGEMAGVASVRTRADLAWPPADAPLDGVLQLHVARLGAWGAWLPPGWRLGGELKSSASLGGRFGAPEVTGRLDGQQLSLRNALEGVQLTDGQVAIRLDGAKARIERFEFKGGDGSLSLQGDATLGEQPQALLTGRAERFLVLGRVDRRLVASGEASLRLTPALLALEGQMKVDEGLIDFSRGGAPALDDDVSIVDSRQAPAAASTADAANGNGKAKRVNTLNVKLDLGNKLRVKGRGLDTRLLGELKVASTPAGRIAVTGAVRTEGGTYAAYGQKLSIDRGLLTFTGPVEDPRLDIFASRPNLDVTVGVAVTGSALNPRVRLSSEPEMADIDKLSWLVLGRASDGLGRADTALLQRAAVALLAGEGEAPTDAFLNSIGITDFGVRQDETGDSRETVVTVGKQLSRRWYLGYERSVNAATGTWQLIYRAAQRFTLRAQSGDDNALDLVWTWRWN